MKALSILIVGAGKLGRESGRSLMEDGHKLTLIEKDRETAEKARQAFGERVITGDGCDPRVLEKAGVARVELVIATTGDDEDNLVVAELARHVFSVPRIFARVNRPENQWLFTAQRGVDYAFCPVCMVTEALKKEMGSA